MNNEKAVELIMNGMTICSLSDASHHLKLAAADISFAQTDEAHEIESAILALRNRVDQLLQAYVGEEGND